MSATDRKVEAAEGCVLWIPMFIELCGGCPGGTQHSFPPGMMRSGDKVHALDHKQATDILDSLWLLEKLVNTLYICFLVELKSSWLCSIKTQILWGLIILIFFRRGAPAFPRSWGSQLSSLLFLKRKEVFLLEFPVLNSLVRGNEVVRGGRLTI